MNCEHCQALIGDYIDGTLPAADRGRIEAHVSGCAACRALADDLRAIRRAAGALERHTPPERVWTRLSASLEAERRRGFDWRPLALAATLLLAAAGTSWMVREQMQAPAPPAGARATPPAPADPELERSVEMELKLAEEHYQKAIAGLEQITRAESAALDPQVASVLQKNLEVIDQAIGESRAALQTQPTSEVAQESLFEALRNKVSLLQDTVGLINEMRKGNQDGAARIVSGLNQ